MARTLDVDHPAIGAGHVFIPGSADSIVAAARLTATAAWPVWVTLAREHRLPAVLERPLTEAAVEIWCLGYSGTGNPLVASALEAHITHRRVRWLSTTSGRLRLEASELAGVQVASLPGGSLVQLVLQDRRGRWTPDDHACERLGYILGRYPSWSPTARELALANLLQGASVAVRNHEGKGPPLIRALAETPVADWPQQELLLQERSVGEELIAAGRSYVRGLAPAFGSPTAGPAVWAVAPGKIPRGVHGKAIAAECWRRKAPVAMVENGERGFTKAWVVLPARREGLWVKVAELFGAYSVDFSWTGRRGAGAVHTSELERFLPKLWEVVRSR